VLGGGRVLLTTCSNTKFTNTSYYDRIGTTPTTGQPVSAFEITGSSTNITVDGFSNYGGLSNVHPYTGIVNVAAANNSAIRVRNIGAPSAPYNMGSASACGVIVTNGGTNSDIKIQRCYVQNTRTSSFGTMVNSDFGVTAECVWGDGGDTVTVIANDFIAKGCKWTNSVTGQTAVYGSHWENIWTSTTAGRIVLHANEKTETEPSASSYEVISGTPKFTSTGSVAFGTSGDEIIWSMPYYAQGITSFAPATATQPTFTGTNPNNHDIYYQIDKNDGAGFNGTWRNLAYKRTGAGGTSGTSTVTMTSTTGVNVDDYVFGTGIGTNSKVVSVDSSTNITVSVNNSGTVSGVLVFNQLPSETSLSAADGVKLKIRVVANTTSATNLLTYLRIDTVTTSSDQEAVAYPLDPVAITAIARDAATSALIEGARVLLLADTGGDLPSSDSVTITRSSSTATVAHTAHGMVNGQSVVISGADQDEYNGIKSISNVSTNSYDFTVSGAPTTPATGTITATAVILSGVTDSSGEVSDAEFPYSGSDQPVTGRVRKGSSSTYYKTALLSGTIESDGLTTTAFLVSDG